MDESSWRSTGGIRATCENALAQWMRSESSVPSAAGAHSSRISAGSHAASDEPSCSYRETARGRTLQIRARGSTPAANPRLPAAPGELPNRRLSRDRPLTQRRGSLAPAVGWICLAGTASPCRCLRMGVVIVPSLGCRSSALPPRRWRLQSETPASTPWITGTQRARVLHRPLRDHDGLGLPGGGDVLEQMNFRPIGHAVRDTAVHPCVASPTRTQRTARPRSLRPGTLV